MFEMISFSVWSIISCKTGYDNFLGSRMMKFYFVSLGMRIKRGEQSPSNTESPPITPVWLIFSPVLSGRDPFIAQCGSNILLSFKWPRSTYSPAWFEYSPHPTPALVRRSHPEIRTDIFHQFLSNNSLFYFFLSFLVSIQSH